MSFISKILFLNPVLYPDNLSLDSLLLIKHNRAFELFLVQQKKRQHLQSSVDNRKADLCGFVSAQCNEEKKEGKLRQRSVQVFHF